MSDEYGISKPGPDDIVGEVVQFPLLMQAVMHDPILEEAARLHGVSVRYAAEGNFLVVKVREGASLQDVADSAKRTIAEANKHHEAEKAKYEREDEEQERRRRDLLARNDELRSQLGDLHI
jgi:hypothetical protein